MEQLILLIDDDKEELDILTMALDAAGIRTMMCAWARSAEYAFHLFDHIIPDFIFLDLNMPRMDGIRCLEHLKKIRRVRDVPVILYSTSITEETRKLALAMGADDCIEKPGGVTVLSERLANLFTRKKAV